VLPKQLVEGVVAQPRKERRDFVRRGELLNIPFREFEVELHFRHPVVPHHSKRCSDKDIKRISRAAGEVKRRFQDLEGGVDGRPAHA